MPAIRPNRATPLVLPLLALLLLGAAGSCFEEPVRDDLHLTLAADGSARVHLTTHLAPAGEDDHPLLARRLAGERLEREAGDDDWSRRLRALGSPDETLIHHREGGVLVVPADEAASLNEISRLAYDPFPARLTVTVPGEIVELEGFERSDSGELRVPGVTLWDALRSVSGVWLSPDPMALIVEESLRGSSAGGDLDPEALATEPRRWAEPLPNGVEIRRVLEERLVPEAVYRLVWRTEPSS